MAERVEALKVGVEAVTVTIVSEPYVVFTRRGYAPVVGVQTGDPPQTQMMYISSVSVSAALQPLVEANGGKFQGLKFTVKRESDDRFAKYVIEPVPA